MHTWLARLAGLPHASIRPHFPPEPVSSHCCVHDRTTGVAELASARCLRSGYRLEPELAPAASAVRRCCELPSHYSVYRYPKWRLQSMVHGLTASNFVSQRIHSMQKYTEKSSRGFKQVNTVNTTDSPNKNNTHKLTHPFIPYPHLSPSLSLPIPPTTLIPLTSASSSIPPTCASHGTYPPRQHPTHHSTISESLKTYHHNIPILLKPRIATPHIQKIHPLIVLYTHRPRQPFDQLRFAARSGAATRCRQRLRAVAVEACWALRTVRREIR